MIDFLTENNDRNTKEITDLKLRVEELATIIFKKSKTHTDKKTKSKSELLKRTIDSYQRNVPKEEEITNRENHTIDTCPDCKTKLSKKTIKIFYVEDIPLLKKVVTEYTTEKGFCRQCKKWHSPIPIPTTNIHIGEHVRNHIAYANTILRLSYQQIVDDLRNRFNFSISSGEIDRILKKKAIEHGIDYERLKTTIQNEPVLHFDETGDKIRDGDGYKPYTWLMQGTNKPEVFFQMGQTRGKGIAENMLEESSAVGVTDDYGVYTNLFADHQLCWAHLHRKLRDLSESTTSKGETLNLCKEVFLKESRIYTRVREISNRNDLSQRQRNIYVTKFSKELKDLAIVNVNDPKKLKTYKQTLLKNIPKYLTCICLPNVPCDNNQAERTLRHVVLKRKTSFGHISARGAETMSILMSVFITIRNRIKGTGQTFFDAYEGFVV
jgi:transposase